MNRQDQKAFYKASFFTTIKLTDGGQPVLLSSGDKLIFGVRAACADFAPYLVKKVLTSDYELNGGYPIEITPEEMTMAPGRYYYDVSVQTAAGSLIRVVPASLFDVKASYTIKEES